MTDEFVYRDTESREKQTYRPPRESAWGRRNGVKL